FRIGDAGHRLVANSIGSAGGVASTGGTAIRIFQSTPHRLRGATGSSCRLRLTIQRYEHLVPRVSAGHAGCGGPSYSSSFALRTSMRFEASALVSRSLKASGSCACSAKVFRYDACAPVLGSSPETRRWGFFWAFEAGRVSALGL